MIANRLDRYRLSAWWKDALQRNAEVECYIWLHIIVRLIAARRCDPFWRHRYDCGVHVTIQIAAGGTAQHIACWSGHTTQRHVLRPKDVAMRRDLAFQQRHGLRAASFAKIMQRETRPLAGMHGRIALQIWQREVGFAVAAVGGAKQ